MKGIKKDIILDVDTGSDDAIAIMYAILSGEFDVKGILVSFGNQALCYTLQNTLKIRELLKSKVKIFKGSSEPLVANMMPGSRQNTDIISFEENRGEKAIAIHEKVFALPEPKEKEEPVSAVMWLVNTLMEAETPITLIPVGPLTNLAVALKTEPRIRGKIEEIVCMGGGVFVNNMTPCAEINFYNDPEAAKIVLDSGIPTRLITLDATHNAWFGYEEVEKLKEVGNPVGDFAAYLLKNRIDAANALGVRQVKKSAIHDVLAVVAVSHPEVITRIEQQDCDVDIGEGYARGGLFVDRRPSAENKKPVRIAYEADKELLCRLLVEALEKYPADR